MMETCIIWNVFNRCFETIFWCHAEDVDEILDYDFFGY